MIYISNNIYIYTHKFIFHPQARQNQKVYFYPILAMHTMLDFQSKFRFSPKAYFKHSRDD